MIKLNNFTIIVLISAIIVLSGCTQRLIDFTIISSKNITIDVDKTASRVQGTDEVVVFLFPLGVPNLKEAVDKAIESAGPEYDALIDGVVSSYNKSFIIGVVGYTVEGTPIKTKESKGMSQNILYHSDTGISNETVLSRMPVNALDESK